MAIREAGSSEPRDHASTVATISSVMLFVCVSSACTLMFLVLEGMLAFYFIERYVWSCVMFDERFTLCFKVVGEFSNIEIYVFFFSLLLIIGLGLFSVCDDVRSSVFFFWLPHRSSASAILRWPNVTVMRKYAFPVDTNNNINSGKNWRSRIYIMSTKFSFIKIVSYLKI